MNGEPVVQLFMVSVIGYGPKPENLPYIPDYLIIRTESGELSYIWRPGSKKTDKVPTEYKSFDLSVILYENMWLAIEEERVVLFLASEEKNWRTRRAHELIASARVTKGDPARSLGILSAASRLQGFELSNLTQRLEQQKTSPTESLDSVVERIKASLVET